MSIEELAHLVLDASDCNCTPQFDGVVPVGTPLYWQANVSKLAALGFTASVPLEQGIKTFTNWCRAELVGV